MKFERLKEFVNTWLLGPIARLKPERIQDLILPGDTPMTAERINNRAEANGYQVIRVPVAIQKRYRHDDFDAAIDFVAGDVRYVAAQQEHWPKVEIDGGDVTVTLGIPIPALLSEADFDVADGIEATAMPPKPDPEVSPRDG